MLVSPSANSQVIVNIQDFMSTCKVDCTITTDASLDETIDSFSRTDETLTLVFAAGTDFTGKEFKIWFGGSPCTITDSSNPQAVTCTLPTNTDGTPIIVAGDHIPIVHFKDTGYADTSACSAETITFTLTSLDITSGPINGGLDVVLTGTGFPLNKQDLSITFDANEATISSVSNI